MKSIYNPRIRAEVIDRINQLMPDATPRWGKMNVFQMLKHCRLWEELSLGLTTYKWKFMGRIFGRMVLRRFLSDERPLPRNSPTLPELIIRDKVEFESEKAAWIERINSYGEGPGQGIMHPFFGPLTSDQVGALSFKHADHHLRQFGV